MSRLIDLDNVLNPITRYKNILKHNQYVSNAEVAKVEAIEWFIHEQEPVNAISLDKVKQAREEISDWDVNKVMDGCSEPFRLGVARGLDIASEILDKLIEEVDQ